MLDSTTYYHRVLLYILEKKQYERLQDQMIKTERNFSSYPKTNGIAGLTHITQAKRTQKRTQRE